jgi:hypothetical protein
MRHVFEHAAERAICPVFAIISSRRRRATQDRARLWRDALAFL